MQSLQRPGRRPTRSSALPAHHWPKDRPDDVPGADAGILDALGRDAVQDQMPARRVAEVVLEQGQGPCRQHAQREGQRVGGAAGGDHPERHQADGGQERPAGAGARGGPVREIGFRCGPDAPQCSTRADPQRQTDERD
eukprot:1154907-Rhodomonas_salina.2